MKSLKLLIASVFVYFILAFIQWDWSPANWSEGFRFGAAVGWITVFWVWAAIEWELV